MLRSRQEKRINNIMAESFMREDYQKSAIIRLNDRNQLGTGLAQVELSPIFGRSHAFEAFEGSGEMTLVGESCQVSNFG